VVQITFSALTYSWVHSMVFEEPLVDPKTLYEVFTKYGPSPRHCYDLVTKSGEQEIWERQIPYLLQKFGDVMDATGLGMDFQSELISKVPSQLLIIVPRKDRRPEFTIITRHVAQHLYRALLANNARKFWEYFKIFCRVSESRSAAGWLWESHVLSRELMSGDKRVIHTEALHARKSHRHLSFTVPGREKVIKHGNSKSLAEDFVRIVEDLHGDASFLFVPAAKNNATFDAFLIEPKRILLIQATVGADHDIKAVGLDFIWDALVLAMSSLPADLKKTIGDLLPNSSAKPLWGIVFAVPASFGGDWNKPQRVDFGGKSPKRAWENYISKQFVWTLEEDDANMGIMNPAFDSEVSNMILMI
jgi:hypothetical protein